MLIGFLYHEGPEGMSIKEIAKNGVRGTLSNIFLFQETKVLKLAADNFFGKQYFFSL